MYKNKGIDTPKKSDTIEIIAIVSPCDALRAELQRYDWDTTTMYAIARAENGSCNPKRHNLTTSETHRNAKGDIVCIGSYGALQVGCLHYKKGENTNDLRTNVAVAYRAWSNRQKWGNGYEAWSTYLDGKYKKFL